MINFFHHITFNFHLLGMLSKDLTTLKHYDPAPTLWSCVVVESVLHEDEIYEIGAR